MKELYDCHCPDCNALRLAAGTPDETDLNVVETAFKEAIKEVHEAGNVKPETLKKPAVRSYIDATYNALSKAVSSGIADNVIPDRMAQALDHDTFMFSGLKAYNAIKEGSLKLRDESGTVKSFDQFYQDVRQIDNLYNRVYLQAEYQFAVHSSQAAARWSDVEEDSDSFYLQYRTAKDSRVREEHALLDEKTLPADDDFWRSYYPPNGWNCRCTVVQVLKGNYPRSHHETAMEDGALATAGKNEIFRFNPGMRGIVFPPKHPYRSGRCENCDWSKLQLAAAIPVNEKCQACKIIAAMKETYSTVHTENGKVRISNFHNKQEKADNTGIAKYFAEKHGEEIDLLGITPNKRNADAFNRTRNIFQEYKTNHRATISAIDNEIRDAKKQADHIVLKVESGISDGDLKDALHDRIKRSGNIKEVIIIRNGMDKKYLREDIIKDDFRL